MRLHYGRGPKRKVPLIATAGDKVNKVKVIQQRIRPTGMVYLAAIPRRAKWLDASGRGYGAKMLTRGAASGPEEMHCDTVAAFSVSLLLCLF